MTKQRPAKVVAPELPLRSELFTVEQLTQHARFLGANHQVATEEGANPLLDRLDENEEIIRKFNLESQAMGQARRLTPAAEWLLDNFYLIEEQTLLARRHLPRRYSRELPRLADGPFPGCPRVYDLVMELISHTDAQLDGERASAFIAAYQTLAPLKMGELWAVPIMLRLGLIENLRRITVRLSEARRERNLAHQWADKLHAVVEREPSQVITVLADLAREGMLMTSPFVTDFCQRLARMPPAVHLVRHWLEQVLGEQGLSTEQLIQMESQKQAADQVSVSHSIASLRFLSALDWKEFVETLSQVNQTLLRDPADIFGKMDFATRDRYRHKVERLARHSTWSESQVAQKAVELAEAANRQPGKSNRPNHVGYYLVDKGQAQLEAAVQVRWPWRDRLERAIGAYPLAFYLGGIGGVTMLATAALAWDAWKLGVMGWPLAGLAILSFICSSQLAISLSNWLSSMLLKPSLLPRLDFAEGIPSDCCTMVVVPTMLTDSEAVAEMLEGLEIHYLANRDTNLHFALLTDFSDSIQETAADDAQLVELARAGVVQLNQKYRANRENIFFLLHRPRLWNPAENIWMGYERKRGKLMELNALLRGRGRERFSVIVGDESLLPSIKFVITLDADTQLPRDVGRQLVGTIAHPLNRSEFDPEKGIVSEGYSILQPRVGISLPGANRSWFARLFSGEAGIDPYTHAVSDVYQDLFKEGSFIGKGIYDVDAFEQALQGRFPENSILSHDLIESLHARSGLVTDVEFYEEYPSRYTSDISRRHRWIRGDWQIAPWLLPRVPGADARVIANPLSSLSRWKILDNLRRSLVPGSLILLLLGSWLLFPQLYEVELWVIAVILFLPALLSVSREMLHRSEESPLRLHLKWVGRSLGRQLGQVFLTIVFLPYDTFVSWDAIVRTVVRMAVTRKRLLQWQPARETERLGGSSFVDFVRTMWIGPALAIVAATLILMLQPAVFGTVSPLLLLWLGSPAIAWWISRPMEPAAPKLNARERAFLGRCARKAWRFFETFVNEQENWLPPDNFQEHPAPLVAARTSPTNMGLSLLANLSACDLGYISMGEMMQRTRNALITFQKMDRYRGHFYNWYDTRTLRPLSPLYVSSVDSGNLAGHLLTLSMGLLQYSSQPILPSQVFAGLRNTLGILRELVRNPGDFMELDAEMENPPSDFLERIMLLRKTGQKVSELAAAYGTMSEEVAWWFEAMQRACRDLLADVEFLEPWFAALEDRRLIAWAAAQPKPADDRDETMADRIRNLWHTTAEETPSLATLADLGVTVRAAVAGQEGEWMRIMVTAAEDVALRAAQRLDSLNVLAGQAEQFADMDLSFLFDPSRKLLAIGYNVTERQRDQSYYDLLASESRLASYVAVAQRKVSQEHWFTLGRVVAATQGEPVLISWSGSMFEYLMPMLVMPSYDDTLLGASCRGAVDAQIAYGNSRGIPWGISESGYNTTDAALNYQYRAFGVPGLGFKRGLGDDLVIAPYATVMALMVAPKEACENLVRLAAEGREGAYGFYEAVDYTPSRLPRGETCVTIRSFMAHHVGMSLVSLLSVLGEHPMQRRFSSHPIFKAVELLLQERLPKSIASIRNEDLELGAARQLGLTSAQPPLRMFTTPNTPAPEVHLLSNEHYHVVVSNAGGGYSRWRNLAVTRWRPDATRDCYGTFCYVRDLQSGEFWSNAHHPVRRLAKHYEAIFTQARAEFRQRYGALEMHTEISVSPEDDVELRRITITNHSQVTRVLEFTSYAEIVMAAASADNAHPAFSNLFVQTEAHGTLPALLCTRRARSEGEKPPWLLHLMVLQGTEEGTFSYETDRSKFIGRGRSLASPAALQSRSGLSNTTGSVLDPVVSIRRRLRLGPDESGRIEIVMGMTETRERAVTLAEKYHSPAMTDRLLDLAWTHSQVTLRQLDATESDAQLFGHLAGSLVYPNAARRAAAHVLRSNTRAQNGLWSYGISGDLPIVLLRSTDPVRLDVVRRLVQAHAYWRGKGLAVDLVIVNEGPSVYRQPLHDQIVALIASGVENSQLDRPGGIFVRRFDQIPPEDRILLQAAARVVLADDQGTVEDQILAGNSHEMIYPELRLRKSRTPQPRVQLPPRELLFFNGLGGFTPDGHEYVITLHPDGGSAEPRSPGAGDKVAPTKVANHVTPMPWVNVLANPLFGTLISESGGGYTWFENSHEFRLTPWSNDPISDTPGEAFYIRDDETGEFWSPAPGPARGQTPYVVRHGFGYTVFEHTESGVATEMWVYVDVERPVKFVSLKLKNLSGRPRKLSVTGYWEMVLGELRGNTAMHVQSEILPASGAILVRNSYNIDFPGHYCFADVNEAQRTSTADREEFLGRNESPASPAAMRRARLSGRSGAGLDPCAALQVTYELGPNQEREVTFMLGAGRNRGEVENLIHACRQPRAGQSALERVWEYWNRTLGVVQVETPDPAVNVLANGWLLYQTLSCRLWGRTGFYQSGGAFGFRDQLQDTMALVHAEPRLLREQLLRAAAHQFREGDVQHWWHPPVGRGVRTHFSDDYLWLPYATCRYVNCLHDTGVLDEEIPYLESRLLTQDEESVYDLPARAAVSGTLYQHCVRAIENGLKFGEHGLPLIGCGDWNDGFNLIGEHGRGESVWLGFFLYDVLIQFAALARSRNDVNFAELCEQQAEQLQRNIELHAWDGQWYRRAYFDNGEPVGSHANSECQIDALPQSWAVLTRAGDPERSQQAMREVAERLVNHKAGLVQLFDPPFDKGELNPGYIKGYVPGVRENGGQYTHAAIWTVMAFAQAGEIEHAWELFEMINPVEHGRTAEKIAVYKVEPYVVAADVYAVPPHTGRGGWTWYTGSAGWMYRLAVETLLGIEREGDLLHVRPRLPRRWQGFKVHYRFCETAYHIRIDAADGEPSASLDGRTLDGPSFPLRNDRVDHQVEIRVRVGDVVPHLEPAGI